VTDRRRNSPSLAPGCGESRRPSHSSRYVVIVGCERLGRLVRYGLPVGVKAPRNAWITVECPCGSAHLADAIPRARRRGETVDIELEEPAWHKRRPTLARQS
jgi:hypothetical protein